MTPSPTPYPEPVEVRHETAARRVVVEWDGGHVSSYPLDYLRSWCPCAGCQGHGGRPRYLDLADQQLTHLEAVGNYAIAFTWQDGHSTGIYSFKLLRSLCPCEECGGGKL